MLPKITYHQAERLRLLANSLNETTTVVNVVLEQGYHAKPADTQYSSNREYLQEKIANLYGASHALFDAGDLSKELCMLEMIVHNYSLKADT